MPADVPLPELVLLPGMDGTGELFAPFVEALPDGFETTTVRFPGDESHSYSELVEVVRRQLPESNLFVVVAESFSTPLAIELAAARPTNLAGLVLCAGFAARPVRGPIRYVLPVLMALAFRTTLPRFLAEHLLLGPGVQEPLLTQVRDAVISVRPRVLLDRLRAILRCDVRAELEKVDVPILYLQATQDRLVPSGCGEEIRQIRPDVVIRRIDGPHLLLQREPHIAADVVSAFVRKLC
ncbi:MAG TPA: alpha/beta hydrolase [Terracidiphilus sp.]|nr:alpha/beta hydrolase [Terracidiphilus sp.]